MQLNLAYGDVAQAMNRAGETNRLILGARRLEFRANGPIFTRFDANLLRRIAGNLIGNAVKFTAPDGVIGVTVARGEAVIRVEVSDNGWGIAPEHHARIFEKFGQIKDSGARAGTGLGLTFVRMAVEAHGGTVGVVSAAGKGSTFWFTLPAADEPIHAAPSA
jgi:signal transduction histidine kinase